MTMATITINDTRVLDSYWSRLRNLSDALKLTLAARLTADVAARSENKTASTESDEEYTARFIKTFSGAWQGPESSDEIIACIKADRRSKTEPVKLDAE